MRHRRQSRRRRRRGVSRAGEPALPRYGGSVCWERPRRCGSTCCNRCPRRICPFRRPVRSTWRAATWVLACPNCAPFRTSSSRRRDKRSCRRCLRDGRTDRRGTHHAARPGANGDRLRDAGRGGKSSGRCGGRGSRRRRAEWLTQRCGRWEPGQHGSARPNGYARARNRGLAVSLFRRQRLEQGAWNSLQRRSLPVAIEIVLQVKQPDSSRVVKPAATEETATDVDALDEDFWAMEEVGVSAGPSYRFVVYLPRARLRPAVRTPRVLVPPEMPTMPPEDRFFPSPPTANAPAPEQVAPQSAVPGPRAGVL